MKAILKGCRSQSSEEVKEAMIVALEEVTLKGP
jgi:hypothetical protein